MRQTNPLVTYAWVALLALGALGVQSAPSALHVKEAGAKPAQPQAKNRSPAAQQATRSSKRRKRTGVTALRERLGPRTPTGLGIVIGHVEGDVDAYLPRMGAPAFRGVTFRPQMGKDARHNDHTTGTCKVIYGAKGMAPGVKFVDLYPSGAWIGSAYLNTGRPEPPRVTEARIFTHSWVAYAGGSSALPLRRVDYLIDTRDIMVIAGVNNDAKTKVPGLMCSSYNGIAVGTHRAKHSRGYTVVEGAGRCKPDITTHAGTTSIATPIIAAIVARLMETADRMGHAPDAKRSEVLKAVLFAGTHKPKKWKPAPGKPLDETWGAGIVQVDRSYDALTSGPVLPGQTAGANGWAFRKISAQETHHYEFDISGPARAWGTALVWHRRVMGKQVHDLLTDQLKWSTAARMANLDLSLYRIKQDGSLKLISESTSKIDNNEHLFRRNVSPGRYRVVVSRKDRFDQPWDYALAWSMKR